MDAPSDLPARRLANIFCRSCGAILVSPFGSLVFFVLMSLSNLIDLIVESAFRRSTMFRQHCRVRFRKVFSYMCFALNSAIIRSGAIHETFAGEASSYHLCIFHVCWILVLWYSFENAIEVYRAADGRTLSLMSLLVVLNNGVVSSLMWSDPCGRFSEEWSISLHFCPIVWIMSKILTIIYNNTSADFRVPVDGWVKGD